MQQSVTLDAFDTRLLAALQDAGTLTNQDLADKVGLSASQCSRRRAALEANGVIRAYRAELSADALGFGLFAFIQVTLAAHSRANAGKFRDLVARTDAIQEAYALTGDADYLLKAVLRDLGELAALVNDTLLAHDSVDQVRSSVVFERLKEGGRLPLSR